jgi:hypothetical protein
MEIGGLIFILFMVIACILVSSGGSDERPIIDSSMEETGRPGYPSVKICKKCRAEQGLPN